MRLRCPRRCRAFADSRRDVASATGAGVTKKLPLAKVYQLLEPGPVVLLTTAHKGRANVMTMSWHMMVEFEPPLVGCVISSANYSFAGLRATKQCVIAVPARPLASKVVKVGSCSGREVDKFATCGLTPMPAEKRISAVATFDRHDWRDASAPAVEELAGFEDCAPVSASEGSWRSCEEPEDSAEGWAGSETSSKSPEKFFSSGWRSEVSEPTGKLDSSRGAGSPPVGDSSPEDATWFSPASAANA